MIPQAIKDSLVNERQPRPNTNVADLHDDFHYDIHDDMTEIAAGRGQIVVLPEINEVQLDLDGPEQLVEFQARADKLCIHPTCVFISKSKSPNRYHVYVKVPPIKSDTPISDLERLAWQATLCDDPTRVVLNMCRMLEGIKNPSCLFEQPDFVRAYPKDRTAMMPSPEPDPFA